MLAKRHNILISENKVNPADPCIFDYSACRTDTMAISLAGLLRLGKHSAIQ
jgi:hypothetical protein